MNSNWITGEDLHNEVHDGAHVAIIEQDMEDLLSDLDRIHNMHRATWNIHRGPMYYA